MTVTTSTTIDLVDIKAVEFECRDCHAKTSIPIAKFGTIPISCNACESQQWLIPGSEDYADIGRLAHILKRRMSADTKRFTMRFQISGVSSREGAYVL